MENTNNDKIVKSSLHYYCLNGLYHTMASLASEGQRMYPGDQAYRFYSGCALAFENRIQEAIREFENCVNDRDLTMAATLALIYSHSKCQIIDKDAIDSLEKRLKQLKEQSNETTLYYASLFLLLSKNFLQASQYIEQLNQNYRTFLDGKVLYGWLIVNHCNDDSMDEKSLKSYLHLFANVNEPDVLIILSKVEEKLHNYSGSIEKLNHAIAMYPRFLPALIEKIKVHAMLKEFELMMDSAFRSLVLDKHCIEPHRYSIIYYLAWDFNEESALSKIRDLISSLELREPKNAYIYFESSRLIARLALNNQNILMHSSSLIERAIFLDPTNIDYICENAFQWALLKRFQESERHYKNAMKLNPADSKPISGLLMTKLMQHDHDSMTGDVGEDNKLNLTKVYEEIDQLEEFNRTTTGLTTVNVGSKNETKSLNSIDLLPQQQDLLYLCLKSHVGRKQKNHSKLIENYLTQLLNHYNQLKAKPLSVHFYSNLQIHQVMDIVQICLSLCAPEPLVRGQQVPMFLHYAQQFINVLAAVMPNHKQILYRMAMIKYLSGEIRSAANLVNRCLQYDGKFIDLFILMAKISIYDRNFKTANQCLENALVLDFKIRNEISYILAKSSILKFERKYNEALQLMKDALQSSHKSTLCDRLESTNVELFLMFEMVDIHLLNNNTIEARKIIEKLSEQFSSDYDGKQEQRARIYLSQARIDCYSGDYEATLQTLRNVTATMGADHYIRSKKMMAAIYLSKYKDRKRFTECYHEIAENFPSQQSQLMLGDAYMHILQPEKAIEIYEQAVKKNPKDSTLVRKVGQALIKAHFFERAVTYYKAAIKSSGQMPSYCYDLAELLHRLGRDDQCKDIIAQTIKLLDTNKNEIDLDTHIIKIRIFNLLAQIHRQSGDREKSIQILRNAHDENQKLMRRLSVEHPDRLEEHRKFSINLCDHLADLLLSVDHDNNQQSALQIYKESLSFDSHNDEIYLKMAKIEMRNDHFDQAHTYCTNVLKNNANMDEALLLMADITFRQADFEGALSLYRELLNKNKTNFIALMRFIDAARRCGQLQTIVSLLDEAGKKCTGIEERINDESTMAKSGSLEAGFYLCKALYHWYTGDGNEAIKYLYTIRNDARFGKEATILIIEICIHPDSITTNNNTYSTVDSNQDVQRSNSISSNSTLKTAETLVEVLRLQNPEDFHVHLLNNLVLLAKKQKNDAEFVLSDLMKYLSNERYCEHSALIYSMAMAYMALKQTPKARNQLKRIAKNNWKYSEGDYLEKAWLLLADIHIQSNKFDNANELLKRILRYNRSCSKAYEYSGYIMEKEQCYRDAAYNYEQAWHFCNQNNPTIGYKLAFNYMKAKRWPEAIDICQKILSRYPDYPKIKKDILDKCVAMLKC
ncbi:tetratricopeptide repeat protein 21b-like [Dermatophagoides farinae]|uniref:Tetratricopeptide repeat protein 21b-like n=1 Tax=Dermatophagoides farinae TaxID=6954 RepID=A0A9D4SBY5_DERFA|nr:tetratricopeptide repeat protein 21B-like [Dermatophagoides farinae]XP_046914208.1 tetratricopeptide repeat protein 21B-like [Dermatophagoides farinae]KAH7636639.1 tetratricopeptide repeat protein 21b-like [Dermatophagoides farinae]